MELLLSAKRTVGSLLDTPRKRIACVGIVMALVWGAMMVCQAIHEPAFSPDWSLMSEVGRRMALGDTLYVDDGGDLRDPVLSTEKRAGVKSASGDTGADGAAKQDLTAYEPGTLTREALFERIEALRERIDEEMELLERMEE